MLLNILHIKNDIGNVWNNDKNIVVFVDVVVANVVVIVVVVVFVVIVVVVVVVVVFVVGDMCV